MTEYTLLEIQEIEDILLVHDLPTDTLINGTLEQRVSLRSLLETDIAISRSIGDRDADERVIVLESALRKMKAS
ncbi:MAG: hypothetical protein HOI21_03560 [Bacteroidetes Order II. Incertae sedis bacterium]|jgi:hypothetical protein|nr:hypothetical protein [Bacteroidetes Order II. bacterium]